MSDRQTYHKRYVSPDGTVVTEVFSETVTDANGTTSHSTSHKSVQVKTSSSSSSSSYSSVSVSSSRAASVSVSSQARS
jgi:hypothetical protein